MWLYIYILKQVDLLSINNLKSREIIMFGGNISYFFIFTMF